MQKLRKETLRSRFDTYCKRQTAVCGYQFHVASLPMFRTQDSRMVGRGGDVCFHSSTHFYFSSEIVLKNTFYEKELDDE